MFISMFRKTLKNILENKFTYIDKFKQICPNFIFFPPKNQSGTINIHKLLV